MKTVNEKKKNLKYGHSLRFQKKAICGMLCMESLHFVSPLLIVATD